LRQKIGRSFRFAFCPLGVTPKRNDPKTGAHHHIIRIERLMIDGRLMEEDRVGERATARTKPQRIEKRILRIADNWQLTGNGRI
jgi:hypothetical protein